MKYIITAFVGACIVSACQPSAPTTTVAAVDSTATTKDVRLPMEARILGTYKGDFGGSPIYITINYCSGNKIAGYNTHKGLRRNVSGTITDKGSKLDIRLSEPGDHEFDGIFSLVMDTSLTTASGSWKPANNKSLTAKQLTITKLQQTTDNLGYFSGDHSDIDFSADGSCTLNYYEKINDSTFSAQMTTLRGTWEKQPNNEVLVNWQANPVYKQHATVFTMIYEKGEGDGAQPYLTQIKGDIFEFSLEEY